MGSAKLTEAQVHEIRASTELQTEIAERFGIGKQHVTDIKSRRRWAWLPDEPDTSHMSPAIPACFSLESTLDEFSQYRKRVDSDTAAAMLMMVDTLNNLDDTRLPN